MARFRIEVRETILLNYYIEIPLGEDDIENAESTFLEMSEDEQEECLVDKESISWSIGEIEMVGD